METRFHGTAGIVALCAFMCVVNSGIVRNVTLEPDIRKDVNAAPKILTDTTTERNVNYSSMLGNNKTDTDKIVATIVESSNMDTSVEHCSLAPKNTSDEAKLKRMPEDGEKMLRYNFILTDESASALLNNRHSVMLKPLQWVLVSGRQGEGLLHLREQFDILSIFMLSIGVRDIEIELVQSPERCLETLKDAEVERLLRQVVISGLNTTAADNKSDSESKSSESICNMHVLEEDGSADFRYFCCHFNEQDQLECEYLHEDVWVAILLYMITFLKIVVLLFSPRYIPGSYYRLKYISAPYVHKLADGIKLSLNFVMTTNPRNYTRSNPKAITFKIEKFKNMVNFKETIQSLNYEVPYKIDFKAIHLRSKIDRLLPEHFVPVSFFTSLHDTFVKCKLRKNRALSSCCAADVCVKSPCNLYMTWYGLAKRVMRFLTKIVAITPWILRVALYFYYEKEDIDMRRKSAEDRQLQIPFPGSYTLYLTPVHVIFICIYALLCLEFCVYGTLSKKMKEQCKFVLRKSFRDMREKDRGEIIKWVVWLALRPCTKYGGLGIFIGLLLWVLGSPFVIAILALYLLPTLNITLRLLAHLFVYVMPLDICSYFCCQKIREKLDTFIKEIEMDNITNSESLERNEKALRTSFARAQQVFIILFSIVSLFSVVFLLTEVVAVLVEIIIYTMMGVILNAAKTLSYVSLFFLLAVYANKCFGSVSKKFLALNKVLNSAILSLGKPKCEEVMYLSPKPEVNALDRHSVSLTETLIDHHSDCLSKDDQQQDNMAFMLKTEACDDVKDPIKLTQTYNGPPRWQVSRLVLFFSKFDVPQIPKSLFFDASQKPFSFLPGSVLINYLKALVQLGIILIFLIFVLVVVLAFGDTYNISTSNQLLATVAGGLLPLLLQKVFRNHTTPVIDKDSISFRVFLHELLDTFKQSWPVYDIVTDGEPIALIPTNKEKTEVIKKSDTKIANEKINGNIDKHVGNSGSNGEQVALILVDKEKPAVTEKSDTEITSDKIYGNIGNSVGENVSNGEQVALIQVDKEKPEVTEKSDTEGYVCFTNRESSEQNCVKINGHTVNHVGENGTTITTKTDEEKLSSTAEPEKDQTLSVDVSEGIPIDFIIDVRIIGSDDFPTLYERANRASNNAPPPPPQRRIQIQEYLRKMR